MWWGQVSKPGLDFICSLSLKVWSCLAFPFSSRALGVSLQWKIIKWAYLHWVSPSLLIPLSFWKADEMEGMLYTGSSISSCDEQILLLYWLTIYPYISLCTSLSPQKARLHREVCWWFMSHNCCWISMKELCLHVSTFEINAFFSSRVKALPSIVRLHPVDDSWDTSWDQNWNHPAVVRWLSGSSLNCVRSNCSRFHSVIVW